MKNKGIGSKLAALHKRLSGVPIWPAAPISAIFVMFEVGMNNAV